VRKYLFHCASVQLPEAATKFIIPDPLADCKSFLLAAFLSANFLLPPQRNQAGLGLTGL
jgi:hypothetical protein